MKISRDSFRFPWLVCLFLSFAHERPILILSSMDRINPRLFDVMVFLGVVFVLPGLKKNTQLLPSLFIIWSTIVGAFTFFAIFYSLFLLPVEYAKYSLFFAGKYLEGLLAIYIALQIPLTPAKKRVLHWMIVIGGVYVAAYCLVGGGTGAGRIEIAPGKYVTYFNKVLTGPLGYNYLHLAQFSSLCAVFAISILSRKSFSRKWLLVGVACFIAWPLLYSGSRSGLVLLALGVITLFCLSRSLRRSVLPALVFVVGFSLLMFASSYEKISSESTTLSRFSSAEGGHNSVVSRLGVSSSFSLERYKWGSIMPVVGGGFYVAPTIHGNVDKYRVGYGTHNTYLFAFEQGGIVVFVLFLFFLYSSFSRLFMVRKYGTPIDKEFASAVLAYLAASLVVFMVGQTFWQGFGSVNFNTFIVLIVMFASRSTSVSKMGYS